MIIRQRNLMRGADCIVTVNVPSNGVDHEVMESVGSHSRKICLNDWSLVLNAVPEY